MGDLGGLSHCMTDSDPDARSRAGLLRRCAIGVAAVIELTLVGALLLWPLIAPGALPALFLVTPAPIYHAQHAVSLPRALEPRRSGIKPPAPGAPPLYQPLVIPPHIDQVSGEAPDIDQPRAPADLGTVGLRWASPIGIAPPSEVGEKNRTLKESAGVMEARLTRRVQPDYPKIAQLMHLSGTVQLHAIIGTDGSVRALEVLSGNQILAQAALAAVHQWRYEPTRLSGQPVEVETYITVKFQID
jgi:periplasmic protein TonB